MRIAQYSERYGLAVQMLPDQADGHFELFAFNAAGELAEVCGIEEDDGKWALRSGWNYALNDEKGHIVESCAVECGKSYALCAVDGDERIILHAESTRSEEVQLNKYVLDGKQIAIGSSDCEISFSDPRVAAKHACITFSEGRWTIRAEEGRLVYLNGLPVKKAALSIGDVVGIYQMHIVFMGELLAVNNPGRRVKVKLAPCVKPKNRIRIGAEADGEPFARSPSIRDRFEPASIRIEAPPAPMEQSKTPAILTMGTSMAMGLSSVVTASTAIQNVVANGGSIASAAPTLVMAMGMMASSLVFPMLNRNFETKQRRIGEEKRKNDYKKYLKIKRDEVRGRLEEQKRILLENYVSADKCCDWIENNRQKLFGFLPSDPDFLTLRLGLGIRPLQGEVKFPEQNFSLIVDDAMGVELRNFEKEERVMEDVPITLSLKDHRITGICGRPREKLMSYMHKLLIELCATHSPDEVKLVLVHPEKEEADWEFARWFPHVWNDAHDFRLIATDAADAQQLSNYLENAILAQNESREAGVSAAHYVIVLTDMRLAERIDIIRRLRKGEKTLPVSIIAINEYPNQLPVECSAILEYKNDIKLYDKNIGAYKLTDIRPDAAIALPPRTYSTRLSQMCERVDEGAYELPSAVDFLQLFKCANLERLRILKRWHDSNPIKTLAAPIGYNQYGDLFSLDLHQKAHGPHGLVAGMTGSGKSEWIITYILSMAMHYSPLEVAFVLIDYKGGGMSDTFKNLPHVVGVIDNLGGRKGITRSMISIESELARRQRLFKQVSEEKHISNIDIYKYQELYRKGEVEQPLPHLILISDEFAELKAQENEFMDKLISAARIGRSLGVHLILATQKPAGVVNEQIVSNSRFRICLKVQDRDDSEQMIRRPDAALLTKTGRFYMQVGFNEIFVQGQCAWCGAPYIEAERYEESVDASVEVINNIGQVELKAQKPGQKTAEAQNAPKQVDAIVEYIAQIAEENGIAAKPLLMPMLQDHILLDDIYRFAEADAVPQELAPAIAMVDDPYQQLNYAMRVNFTLGGNALVYGHADSGREMFAHAVVDALCSNYTPDDVHIYMLDFDTASAGMFEKMPCVGDIAFMDDGDKVKNLMMMLNRELAARKKLCAAYGGSIEQYRMAAKEALPSIVVTVENYLAFAEGYEDCLDDFYRLTREGTRYGIYFLMTLSDTRSVYRIAQNFGQSFVLQMNNQDDYVNIVGKTGGLVPMERPGSGIYRNERVVEFQIGAIAEADCENVFACAEARSRACAKRLKGYAPAKRIPLMPEHVLKEHIARDAENVQMDQVPVGVDAKSLDPVYMDFAKQRLNLVTYKSIGDMGFMQGLAQLLAENPDRSVWVLDAARSFKPVPGAKYEIARSQAEISDMIGRVNHQNARRWGICREAEIEEKPCPQIEQIVLLIPALDNLLEAIRDPELVDDETGFTLLDEMQGVLGHGKPEMNFPIIFAMPINKFSAVQGEEWAVEGVDRANGLWLGGGVGDQYTLSSDNSYKVPSVPDEEYGYLLKNRNFSMAKLLKSAEFIKE